MNTHWYADLLYGLISGLTEILPVSSQAHRFLLMKLFGGGSESDLLRLLTDLGILAALYYACQNHIIRIVRAHKLYRIPKKRRKRPLDTRSLMDFSLFRMMVIPVILAFFLYGKLRPLGNSMVWVAIFLFINGLILYVPQFFPSGNRDSRNLSRVSGLLLGLGGAAAVVPGISGIGTATSVSSVCGVDKTYGLNMTLLMHMCVILGFVAHDVIALVSNGAGDVRFGTFLLYLLSGAAAFAGATLAIRIFKNIVVSIGHAIFAYYCWGVALFAFIMNLLA